MRRRAIPAAVLLSVLAAAPAMAAPGLAPVGTFAQPVHVAGPAGDTARLFVVEKAGRVQIVVNGQPATPFADLTSIAEAAAEERGLLSIAFPADYAQTGLFYVFLTAKAGALPGVALGDLVVLEGRRSSADPNQADPAHQRVVLTVPHPVESNHNGGQLAFGPDGALYVSTGDGGGQGDPGNDAQRRDSNLGKILRVDPRGSAGPSIWALGLRNPWRFSFDRTTGDMLIGDVGGGLHEEVDFAPAGTADRNYGWKECEGTEPTPCPVDGAVAPALSLPRSEYTGIIGGFVVRDPGLPTLHGRYVFGDLTKDTVMSAAVGAAGASGLRPEPGLPVSFPTSFGEDGCGHVYVAVNGGAVSRIQDGAVGPCVLPPSAPPGPPAGTPPAVDRTPCAVKAAAQGTQRILRRGKRLRLTLRATERCTVTLRAKRFRTRRVTLQPGVKRAVRLTPTKKGLRKLRRARARSDRRRLRITVRISALDAAGNRSAGRVRPRVR
jgi:glucose/arabinose dehydrogenase